MKLWILIFICFHCLAYGQTRPLTINATYHNAPWEEVVKDLEDRYPLQFYYPEAWTSGFEVTAVAEKLSLKQFLSAVFNNTSLHFYISGNQVVLTKDHEIISKWSKPSQSVALDVVDPSSRPVLPEEPTPTRSIRNYTIGVPADRFIAGKASVYGYVRDINSGEPLVGTSVFVKDPLIGTITDAFGYYLITLPKGVSEIHFQSIGMKELVARTTIHSEGSLNIEMEESITSLKEIVISDEKDHVESVQTGIVKLNIKDIKNIPTALGEVDVMKIALSVPGVQSVGEGALGFNVRGGNTDQNLVLLNNTVIYNPSHLFGFFSAFNPDVIKSANLYKSGIQAQYGGRLASVFDIGIRDGNKKKLTIAGGISPITGRVTLEGPIKKDTSSFLLGIRSTYSDYILNLLDDPALKNSDASFSDVIGKVTSQIDTKNNLTASFYHSRDRFRLNSDTLYRYFNSGASLQWRHTFSNKFFGHFSASFSNYNYNIQSNSNPNQAFDLNYAINQINANADFDYLLNERHSLKFGLSAIGYSLKPGTLDAREDSNISPVDLEQEKGVEYAVYIGDEFVVSPTLSLYGGLRFSGFGRLGPQEVYSYQSGLSKEVVYITDTVNYQSGEWVQAYGGLEYRFSLRYIINSNLSLKLSLDKTRQYIHLLTNTTAIAPTDVWRLSDKNIKPQVGLQYSAGLYRTFYQQGLEISLEGYFKTADNLLEYKSGADLFINEVLETDIIRAKGRSYGLEFLLRKKSGKLNGWISYTYSRSEVQAASEFLEEQINNGAYYPSNFDQPHNLSVITNYKFNQRINMTLNFNYHTGRPTTLPFAQYQLNGQVVPFFTDRNQFRIPDYIRFDLAINLEGNHKVDKLAHGSWSFSVYNLLGRANAFSVFTESGDGNLEVFKLSVFAQPIPTITYNFKF